MSLRNDEYKDWLSTLKVGDNFKVPTSYGSRGYSVYKISRETNTRFFYWKNKATNYEGSFRKSDGLIIGSNDGGRFSSNSYAMKITEADLAATYKRSLLKYIHDKDWAKFTSEQLKQVYDLTEMLEQDHATKDEGE